MFDHFQLVCGFHPAENDSLGPFIWAKASSQLRVLQAARYAELQACYYGNTGSLTIRSERGSQWQIALGRGWHAYVFGPLDAHIDDVLDLHVTPLIDVPGDGRELGLMIRRFELFDDARRFAMLSASQANRIRNQQEYESGQVVLESVPPYLRINMEVRCNIPEKDQACVYCAWDWAKELERGSPPFTIKTLDDLGDFYRYSTQITDCSIGEPTMHKQFGEITARIDEDGKHFSLTTNGQLLTPKRRRELLGRNIELYLSVDSPTAQGYARYRNDRWNSTLENLGALCREKREYGNLPRVYVSCLVMRSNLEDLPRFLTLMSELGVDQVKLRALYLDDNVNAVTTNNGYRFDYAGELLTSAELAEIGERVRRLAQAMTMDVYVEWDQFPVYASEAGAPLCSEPWKTLYVLRRGIMPCCYGTDPVATWGEQRGRPLDVFLRSVFNSPKLQEIRGDLAKGRLSNYCLRSPSCPIVKQARAAGRLAASSCGFA